MIFVQFQIYFGLDKRFRAGGHKIQKNQMYVQENSPFKYLCWILTGKEIRSQIPSTVKWLENKILATYVHNWNGSFLITYYRDAARFSNPGGQAVMW